jgi:hypothetical protein
MQITPDPGANQAPSSRGPSVQWIGVQWQGAQYALPLSSLTAVFKTAIPELGVRRTELDIEVHEGDIYNRHLKQYVTWVNSNLQL